MEFDDRCSKVQEPKFDCLLFDLDDTLYPMSSGISAECKKNIGDYMAEKLRIDRSKIEDLSNQLYKNYGTTMAGLRAVGYNFDYDDYHSFVHGRLPYENIKPDPVLRQILVNLPIRKVIFTNGDKIHAARALKRLGLEDCFEGIICFETLNPSSSSNEHTADITTCLMEMVVDNCLLSFSKKNEQTTKIFDIVGHFAQPADTGVELPKTPVFCKPNMDAMEQALKIANVNPHKTIFFDDSVRNIRSGKSIGLHTVLVGTSHRVKGADHALESLHNMKEALPELWEEAEKPEDVLHSGKVAIETFVTA